MKCKACGYSLDGDSRFCENCGQAVVKKKSKKLRIALVTLSCLVLVLGILAAIFLPPWLGPLTDAYLAGKHTLNQGNFTFHLVYTQDGDTLQAQGRAAVDMDKQTITAVYDVTEGSTVTHYVLYQNYLLSRRGEGQWKRQDYSRQVQEIFDTLNSSTEPDLKQLLKDYYILWLVEGYLDVDKVEQALPDFIFRFNDETWLEENAGYHKEKRDGVTYHCMEVGMMEFLAGALPDFKDAFHDEGVYNKVLSWLEKDRQDTPMALRLGVKSWELRQLQIEFGQRSLDLKLSKIGDTKIDTKPLQALLDETK